MNRKIFRGILGLVAVSAILVCSFAEAQRFGGVAPRPGGGVRPAMPPSMPSRPVTPPNLSALQAHFGDSSIIHRDTMPSLPNMPNITRPTTPRPNISPSANRPSRPNLPNVPNISDQNLRNIDRSNLADAMKKFGPDNRDQIFNKADHTIVNRDGPDWKNWQNFNPQKINKTVINKIDIDNRSINIIRDNFNKEYNRNEFFNQDWYEKHPNAWRPGLPNPYPPHPPGPHPPGPYPPHPPGPHPHPHPYPPPPPHWWWGHPPWHNAWGWFSVGFFAGAVTNAVLTPVPYYYGSNIVYIEDTVYVNNVPYVSSNEYYQQAQNIAKAGAVPAAQPEAAADAPKEVDKNPTDEWLPMGTFVVVADGKQKESKRILQIATNKQGQVRGNFINQEADTVTELYGAVDPQTQRVAFKAKGNESLIAECGLWNLTQDTVPMLVHLDKNRTEERTLIRLTDDKSTETH